MGIEGDQSFSRGDDLISDIGVFGRGAGNTLQALKERFGSF